MFVLQVVVVLLLAIGAVVMLVLAAQRASTREADNRSFAVAQSFASSPGLVEALKSPDPTAVLQPRVEEAGKRSNMDFVGVMNRDGIYYALTSPNGPGTRTTADMAPLLAGRTVRDQGVGSLGPAIRAYVPVKEPDGSVVGVVGAGVTIKHVGDRVAEQLPAVLGGTVGAVAVTMGGAGLLSRRLLRQTRGLGPAEITRMYEHHDAVLHSVKEGVLVLDEDGRLLLANDEAQRLLDLSEDAERRLVSDLGLDPRMAELLISQRMATDEVHLAGDRLLAVNVRPTVPSGEPAGIAVTLRDTTELRALAGKAEAARDRLKLLYDAGVRIGTTLDVVRTAEELAKVATPRFADVVTVELAEPVLHGEEPAEGNTEMRRTAASGVRQDSPLYPVGELIRFAPSTPMVASVASGHPVLEADLRTADGWQAQDPEQARRVLDHGIHSLITVPLQARGVVLGLANFWRLESTGPFEEEDLSFAEELAARAALAIDNARRYTREHALAITLQRSLLPHDLPEQTALEVAHRYQPAQAGVGGDWFDVIPLPGTRVALVVGDVVGHGLHAAATMGRLRTAVHNFSALDLAPDELLARLDELVAHLDTDQATEEDGQGITGATCLYAIYDPVSGMCTIARAGHLGPALVHPDGTVTYPDTPVSPPLGLGGGLPFEAAALELPEGSRLTLFTDGLIENRHRDIDTGLDLLRTALTGHPDRTPEATCQAVFDALLPERPTDDIALLVARTHLLDPGQFADWDVPDDPAAVSRVRADVTQRLEAWGLAEIGFATELILSELVTNAIRYGAEPIHVRLLHDRNRLICEVADGSSTSPHLRRAKNTDEGGRGLFLVAQFAQRWGTRYTPRGKIIWTEQALHDGATEPGTDLTDILLDQWDESPRTR
ncbi:SpoIIE family protein phosphatase [Streptomyces sp. NBC_01446]|uniref:SpoIIE family protein phosphatase n=1 Tax=Streptomyces sp. NBC_01446 TaxID=2903870 RepID=UPI0022567273|nr:SpoIIE family protein phosphatase [Streptomyces sp. NBC_01446]MCX4647058.1 SpoIIE family protein phosphatase [Streptomyces sp. NBC_01446]